MTQQNIKKGRDRLLPIFRPYIHPLIEVREQNDICQFDLEHRIGIARGYLSKWENGIRTPSLYGHACWAEALGMGLAFYKLDDANSMNLIVANDNGELIANDNLIGDTSNSDLFHF